jgi:endonuclease/exonuclease/phosphatase family metal-dependent hydrolase
MFTLLTLNTALLPYNLGLGNNANRAQHIADVIIQQDYDIVTLQEVFDYNCVDLFLKKLAGIYSYHAYDTSSGRFCCCSPNSGLMIFSKWPIKNVFIKHYSLHRNSDNFAKKGALGALITVNSLDIYVCTTHLQAGGDVFPLNLFDNSSLTPDQIKNVQMTELVTDLSAYITTGQPIIICGDFNVSATSSEFHTLLNTIQSKFPSAKDIFDPASTLQTTISGKRIDFVITDLNGVSTIINNFTNLSDHRAVTATFI